MIHVWIWPGLRIETPQQSGGTSVGWRNKNTCSLLVPALFGGLHPSTQCDCHRKKPGRMGPKTQKSLICDRFYVLRSILHRALMTVECVVTPETGGSSHQSSCSFTSDTSNWMGDGHDPLGDHLGRKAHVGEALLAGG